MNEYQKMSMISQSTQDSWGSLGDSDSRLRDSRLSCTSFEDQLQRVSQRLNFAKANIEDNLRKEEPTGNNSSLRIPLIIGALLAIITSALISGIRHYESYQELEHQRLLNEEEAAAAHRRNCEQNSRTRGLSFNIENLFDPVQVNYIKSYEESAVGKYYYWDLLAEEYFKLIKEQLIKIIWMEEEVIEQFFNSKFNAKESQIIRKKVWKLRDKSGDIEVDVNINNKTIWRYKHCYCVDPKADRSKLNV